MENGNIALTKNTYIRKIVFENKDTYKKSIIFFLEFFYIPSLLLIRGGYLFLSFINFHAIIN